jgi:hypothetical protein
MAKPTIRLRLARAILGRHAKEFIPPLSLYDRFGAGFTGSLNDYRSKAEQLEANLGWCFAANNAIAEPTAAVKLKLTRKTKAGKTEEIAQHEILELFKRPNAAHTGAQLRNLHFTYMNFVGESYTYMRDDRANEFVPARGKLPAALEIFPSHLVQFKLGETYSQSTVKYGNNDYRLQSVVRDLNPDPGQPYHGRSIIRATTLAVSFGGHPVPPYPRAPAWPPHLLSGGHAALSRVSHLFHRVHEVPDHVDASDPPRHYGDPGRLLDGAPAPLPASCPKSSARTPARRV